jgi:hypothetical protein
MRLTKRSSSTVEQQGLHVEDFLPLLHRIERRMMGMIRLLRYQGRLTLVNPLLSSLPTYFMCALKVPSRIWGQVDKYRKHCL